MNNSLLKKIGNAHGIPGYEDEIQSLVEKEFKDCCDDVWRDHMGSVFGLKKATGFKKNGKRPLKLMFAAHADEIGMMVKHINSNGYIHFIQMGGLNPVVSQSQRVIIHGREKVRGVIAPRTNVEGNLNCKLEDLLIDTGLPKSEVEKMVSPGDIVTYEGEVSVLNDKVWVGRNWDNRIGLYCLVEAMRQVGETAVDVYAVSTVQEEVGIRGARPAAFAVAPDIGIAIDGSMARMAYVPEHEYICDIGKGTGIYVVDKLTIGHAGLLRGMFDMCKERGIPYQKNIGGGTDATALQQSRSGAMATTVGAPVRYMHSTVQLCHADDMDATVNLLIGLMQTANKIYDQLGHSHRLAITHGDPASVRAADLADVPR